METRIQQANDRLKLASCRVRVRARGNRLYLQATLPPKPGSDRTCNFQQEIALGVMASPSGVQLAEREARKISALLDCKEFEWASYLPAKQKPPERVDEWLDQFNAEFSNSVSSITWETDYREVFIKLDGDRPLTHDYLVREILRTKPNSKTRKRFCRALGKLAQFAGLDGDFSGLSGNYSARAVDPRSLPDDETILKGFSQVSSREWRYVYGLLATFGLRPHECFNLDTSDLASGGRTITVLKGKTGRRQVWPFYPEWIDEFGLRDGELPPVTARRNSDYGDRTSQYFHRSAALPFRPYDLRHAWAVRTVLFGLPDSLSAQQMGHSLLVHNQTYQAWITAKTHEAVFDSLNQRSDRPVAPMCFSDSVQPTERRIPLALDE